VVSTTEREVWLWDITHGELLQRFDTPPSAAKSLICSPDGKYLTAGIGSDMPTPFVSGIVVWHTSGAFYKTASVPDWVYTVRWQDNSRLIAGAGMPSGAEAAGTVYASPPMTRAKAFQLGVLIRWST
jgi:WD40 repeat protein